MEVLARFYRSKYLIRLNNITILNKLRIYLDNEDLTTFITSLEVYKYKLPPFSSINIPALY